VCHSEATHQRLRDSLDSRVSSFVDGNYSSLVWGCQGFFGRKWIFFRKFEMYNIGSGLAIYISHGLKFIRSGKDLRYRGGFEGISLGLEGSKGQWKIRDSGFMEMGF
ncbi:hypothetical protein, partial [Hydrogenimonas sp.]